MRFLFLELSIQYFQTIESSWLQLTETVEGKTIGTGELLHSQVRCHFVYKLKWDCTLLQTEMALDEI